MKYILLINHFLNFQLRIAKRFITPDTYTWQNMENEREKSWRDYSKFKASTYTSIRCFKSKSESCKVRQVVKGSMQ